MITDLVSRLSMPKQYGSTWKNSVHPAYQRSVSRGKSINREQSAPSDIGRPESRNGRPESRNGRPISRNDSSVKRERSLSINKNQSNLLIKVPTQNSPSKLTDISIPRHDSPIRVERPKSRQESPVFRIENNVKIQPRPQSHYGNRSQSVNDRNMRTKESLRQSL